MSRQKRALVVDDSKSARLILRRMLEKHGLIVDTVASAAEALEFLVSNRPDAIFMDHMMPGMDGFEAVRAIKDNPRTATIPVMMYTSKGGDLYLGQARALGAVGVLPKTVAPAELYESLKRIGLLSERRYNDDSDQQGVQKASERFEDLHRQLRPDAPVIEAVPDSRPRDETSVQAQLHRMLDEQRVEIRKDLLLGLDTAARQSREKLDHLLDEKIEALHRQLPPPAQPPSVFPTVLLIILLFISLTWNYASRHDGKGKTRVSTAEIAATDPAALNTPRADRDTASPPDSPDDPVNEAVKPVWKNVSWALNQDTNYPWNEIALDGARMQTVAQLLDQLANSGFSGRLILETHTGEFCLQGSQEKGFTLADEDLTLDQCSAIMNPVQPTDLASTHQSLAFANLVASSPWLQDGTIELEIHAVPRSEPLVDYPPREASTKAGEWNRAATANNHVHIRLIPKE